MEFSIRHGARRALEAHRQTSKRYLHASQPRLSTTDVSGDIRAASPIRFTSDANQFTRGRRQTQLIDNRNHGSGTARSRYDENKSNRLLRAVRIVPASPSYFTALPQHMDDVLHLSALLRKYQLLPTLPSDEAPRVAWKRRLDYQIELQEPVRAKSYRMMLGLLKRLAYIHPSLIPEEVTASLERYKRLVQPHLNKPKPIVPDSFGRTRALGRRKSSRAAVFLVEGDGQCLINGKTLAKYFGRMHDRESAVWALKATQRLDKYNVWALVEGGGTTGQAEAITLAVAKALMGHEPALKPALRRAGVVARDPRRVERKKPGKLKARKMPAWVKR